MSQVIRQTYSNHSVTYNQPNLTYNGEVTGGDDLPQYIKAAWARAVRTKVRWRGGR
jgi:hypothetical protein